MKEFVANRLSSGNRIFPDKVTVEESGISLRTPNLLGGKEKTLLYHQINSVETSNPLVGFSTVKFRTRNYDTIECKGFTKDETEEIKRLVTIGINSVRNEGNIGHGSGYNTARANETMADLERERLSMLKQQKREERADKLRQEGRPFHALLVEYSDAAAIIIILMVLGIITLFETYKK